MTFLIKELEESKNTHDLPYRVCLLGGRLALAQQPQYQAMNSNFADIFSEFCIQFECRSNDEPSLAHVLVKMVD